MTKNKTEVLSLKRKLPWKYGIVNMVYGVDFFPNCQSYNQQWFARDGYEYSWVEQLNLVGVICAVAAVSRKNEAGNLDTKKKYTEVKLIESRLTTCTQSTGSNQRT